MGTTLGHSTAILVFANSAKEEARNKVMPHSQHLFDALSETTLRLVGKTGLPYYHFTEAQQKGMTFGERFTNAVKAVFDLGYDSIITIGNDTPQLTAAQLIKTAALLKAGRTVLGPSADGGFYLMGLHTDNYYAPGFQVLPWQSKKLLAAIKALFSSQNIIPARLRTYHDIDSFEDIKQISKFIYGLRRIIRLALRAFDEILSVTLCPIPTMATISLGPQFNKGSPFS